MTAGFADEPLIDAEPVPDTGAFAEPASMAERRDHLTEVRQAVRDERERIRRGAVSVADDIDRMTGGPLSADDRLVAAATLREFAARLDDFAAEAAAHD